MLPDIESTCPGLSESTWCQAVNCLMKYFSDNAVFNVSLLFFFFAMCVAHSLLGQGC